MNPNEEFYTVRSPRKFDSVYQNLSSIGELDNDLGSMSIPPSGLGTFDSSNTGFNNKTVIPFKIQQKAVPKPISEYKMRHMKTWDQTNCFLAIFDDVIVGIHKCDNKPIEYIRQSSKGIYNELVRDNRLDGQKYLYMLNMTNTGVVLVVVIPRDLYVVGEYSIDDLQFGMKDFDTCEYINVKISYLRSTKVIQDYDISESTMLDNKRVIYTLYEHIKKNCKITQTFYDMTYIWNVPRRPYIDVWKFLDE